MKKINVVLSVLCMLLFLTNVKAQTSSSQSNSHSLEGRARHAAHDCLQPYHGGIYEITASTTTTGICFVQGFTHRVSFYAGPKCNGTGPCPTFPTRLIATVDFGCEDEIIAVTCY
ncbi:MAG: hypothetical protein JWO44_1432 [Bacteroidetes bacterium]|nr:hypothetical protein [Bacteroidota bacterium]